MSESIGSGETEYDCLACGHCCFNQPNFVQLFAEDLVVLGKKRVEELVVGSTLSPAELRPGEDGSELFMRMVDGHCINLDPVPGRMACKIYEDRPLLCRVYEPGSRDCLRVRAAAGL